MGTLAERLRIARNAAGISQTVAGDEFGITREAVSQWETGGTNPSNEKLPRLAKLYNVSLTWLLAGVGPQTPFGTETLSEIERQAAALARALPDDQRAAWFQVGRALAQQPSDSETA